MKIGNDNMNDVRNGFRVPKDGEKSNDMSRFNQVFRAFDTTGSIENFDLKPDAFLSMASNPVSDIIDTLSSYDQMNLYDNDTIIMGLIQELSVFMEELKKQNGGSSNAAKILKLAINELKEIVKDTAKLSNVSAISKNEAAKMTKNIVQKLSIALKNLQKPIVSEVSKPVIKTSSISLDEISNTIKSAIQKLSVQTKKIETNKNGRVALGDIVNILKYATQDLSIQVKKLDASNIAKGSSAQKITALKQNFQSLTDQVNKLQKPADNQSKLKQLQYIIIALAEAVKNTAISSTGTKADQTELQNTVKDLISTIKNLAAQLNTLKQSDTKLKSEDVKVRPQENIKVAQTIISKTIESLNKVIQDLKVKSQKVENTRGAESTLKNLKQNIRDLTAQVEKLQKTTSGSVNANNLKSVVKELVSVYNNVKKMHYTTKPKHVDLGQSVGTLALTIAKFAVYASQLGNSQKANA